METTANRTQTEDTSVDGSVIEGLFVRALKVDGALADELRSIGIDVRHLKPRYSRNDFRRGLDVAGKKLFPDKLSADADRELGRLFTQGFLSTIVGSVMGAALSVLSPERFIQRLPKTLSLSSKEITAVAIEQAPRHWIVESSRPGAADFTAGAVEVWMKRMRLDAAITVTTLGEGYRLTFRW